MGRPRRVSINCSAATWERGRPARSMRKAPRQRASRPRSQGKSSKSARQTAVPPKSTVSKGGLDTRTRIRGQSRCDAAHGWAASTRDTGRSVEAAADAAFAPLDLAAGGGSAATRTEAALTREVAGAGTAQAGGDAAARCEALLPGGIGRRRRRRRHGGRRHGRHGRRGRWRRLTIVGAASVQEQHAQDHDTCQERYALHGPSSIGGTVYMRFAGRARANQADGAPAAAAVPCRIIHAQRLSPAPGHRPQSHRRAGPGSRPRRRRRSPARQW